MNRVFNFTKMIFFRFCVFLIYHVTLFNWPIALISQGDGSLLLINYILLWIQRKLKSQFLHSSSFPPRYYITFPSKYIDTTDHTLNKIFTLKISISRLNFLKLCIYFFDFQSTPMKFKSVKSVKCVKKIVDF